ncbi:carbohydrate binding domain-containing protein [Streptacidiphilus sp. ASG 303]|uniref:chitinase n=1 Tax=Streptacidiphilus sp. ASG 303 TaxID=2896847 RepID=UPI001E350FF5|nr:glycosyl hydrolase family 18 protein [Streptacidiphilus sp. ASG 303]MCD0485774.1 carbohydrate binding domain-containing protein [Streptacidiphilus sp. ASG 303]
MGRAAHRRRRRAVGALAAGAAALAAAAAATALAPGGASAADGNQVVNGGFEAGSGANWTCSGKASVTTASVHAGTYALKSTPSATDTGQCRQKVSVRPNTAYTLSAWVRGPFVYLGTKGNGTTDVSTWTTSSSWSQLSTTFRTGASTTSVTVYVHGWYAQGAFGADDVVLTGPGGAASPSPSASPTAQPSQSPTAQSSASPASQPATSPPPASQSPASAPPPSASQPPSGGLPGHLVTGYWQDFDNGAAVQRLRDVQDAYDIVAVAFADADPSRPGGITFALDPALSSKLGGYTDDDFKADVAAKHAAGKKVVLSVGGQNGNVSVTDSATAANFADSAYALMRQYGFDGIDVDLENGVDATSMAQALHTLASEAGPGFVLTMAPETLGMDSTDSAYFRLALAVKDVLTVVNTQFYNSGPMNGCDGRVHSQGTVDFITSQVCTQVQGGLDPSQVGIGVPASASAAGSGYVQPSVVDDALDCLAAGDHCGSFVPPAKWPGIRGAMAWSANWDAANGNAFSDTVGAHVHALP